MILHIKVIPNAPKTELRGVMADGTLKIAVHAPRDQGKANDELIVFLSQHFSCPRGTIRMISGSTASRKMIGIEEK